MRAFESQSNINIIAKLSEPLKSGRFTSSPGQVITTFITLQPEFAALLRSIDALEPFELIQKCQSTLFDQSVNMHLVLRKQININASIEQVLVSLRKAYLQYYCQQPTCVQPEHLQTMVTIACQSFNNEYLFYQTTEEEELCGRLFAGNERAASDGLSFVSKVVAYAMYYPIYSLPLNERQLQTLSQHGEYVQELIDRQIKESALEANIAVDIPSFGRIDNEVSTKVRLQYEEAPYPRWVHLPSPEPRQFNTYIKKKFPFLDDVLETGTLQCLCAGCGTGQHALQMATKFADSSVVAVDLSRRSLAYGMNQASRYGISNIEFVQGDLLQIKALKRDFDLIEAVGVLHHMEDPFSGLQALTDELRPGGFMKISVYRRSVRERLKPARERMRARLGSFASPDLRSGRHELFIEKSMDFLMVFTDFYYLSGFRDLICNVQETSFAPLEFKEPLQKLNLSLLGVDYSDHPAVEAAFLKAYPGEDSSRNLDLCEEFEACNSELMPSLFKFWVRKIG